MSRLALSFAVFPLGLVALACATDPDTVGSESEQGKTHAVITVERADPASPEVEGSASAVARFVSVPAFTDANRVLGAAGLTVDLPAPDTCQTSDTAAELEPAFATPEGVELVEAGDVTIAVADAVTSLVPHAFPTVGAFASGVLYATRDRASAALPSSAAYVVTATGSESTPALHVSADAPSSPTGVQIAGAPLRELSELETAHPISVTWPAGDASDLVYVELLAYDGSPAVTCTFHDEAGAGVIPADTFTGTGTGRVAVHRVRTRSFDGPAAASEMRFDFQVGAPVEFAK